MSGVAGLGTALALVAAAVAGVVAVLALRRERRARARAGELETRLAAAERRVADAAEAREAFFDLATHELRSPLSAILGYQELLRDGAYGCLQEGAEEPVERIGRSARHLLHLIEGVVELARLRGGEVKPDLGAVNLDVLLSAVAEAFSRQATERGLEPTVRARGPFPEIRSDQDRLVRALDLLVTSAVKHPADGAEALQIDPLDDGAVLTLSGAAITVRDDADDPAVRFGIRLAVAMGIARLLGGELRLEPAGEPVIERLVFTVRAVREASAAGL